MFGNVKVTDDQAIRSPESELSLHVVNLLYKNNINKDDNIHK